MFNSGMEPSNTIYSWPHQGRCQKKKRTNAVGTNSTPKLTFSDAVSPGEPYVGWCHPIYVKFLLYSHLSKISSRH